MAAALAISVSPDQPGPKGAERPEILSIIGQPSADRGHGYQFPGLLDGLKIGFVGPVGLAHVGQLNEHIDIGQLDHAIASAAGLPGSYSMVNSAGSTSILATFGTRGADRTVEFPGETDRLAAIGVGARRVAGRLGVGEVFGKNRASGFPEHSGRKRRCGRREKRINGIFPSRSEASCGERLSPFRC
jgi:hypothetical protein